MRNLSGILLFLATFFAYAETVQISSGLYEKYNDLLSLELDTFGKEEKVTGHYTINAENELDGSFELYSENSGVSEEFETEYEFVKNSFGRFSRNVKTGLWKYEYAYNDGVDMYEKHTITILFENGKCISSTFEGQMGHIMPMTKHSFNNPELCTSKAIRNKAWELWGIEFERRKKSGEL